MLSNVCEYFPGTYDPYMFICSPWEGRTFNFVSVNQFGGFFGLCFANGSWWGFSLIRNLINFLFG